MRSLIACLTIALAALTVGCAYKYPTEPTPVVATAPPPAVAPIAPPVVTPPAAPIPAPNPLSVRLLVLVDSNHVATFGMASEAIAEARWAFGDGATATTALPTTKHQYAPGTWTATLSVTVPDGRTASDWVLVSIAAPPPPPPAPVTPAPVTPTPPVAPTPSLSVNVSCSTTTGLSVACNIAAFDETGTRIASNDFASVTWDFGDGTVVPGAVTAQHTYGQAGTFIVVVTATAHSRTGTSATVVKVP